MARPSKEWPTDGELNILRVLWERGPTRLSEICETLSQERKVAPTTVATMLKIMREKGQVKRVKDEGVAWEAILDQETAGRGLIQNILDRVFDGSARSLVLNLLDQGKLSSKDREEIRTLLATKRGKAT